MGALNIHLLMYGQMISMILVILLIDYCPLETVMMPDFFLII